MTMLKNYLVAITLLCFSFSVHAQNNVPIYKNASASTDARVKDLMSRMTLPEKIAQMRHIHENDYDVKKKVDLAKLITATKGLSYGCVEAFPYSSLQYTKAIYIKKV